MIIGISGKIGSGKDTVAKMIQYLSINESINDSDWRWTDKYQLFMKETNLEGFNNHNKWEVKRFADELKDTVCRWIGYTREQLEDREFKEKPLGEEWHVWWTQHKNKSKKIFSTESERDEYLDTLKVKAFQTYEDTAYGDYRLTPRKLMQLLGTEAGRQIIHPNIWVNALMADYKPKDYIIGSKDGMAIWNSRAKDWGYGKQPDKYPNWIIPDTRFLNEARAIKDRGGILIRVHRNIDKRFPKLWTEFGYDGNKAMLKNDFYVFLKKHHPEMYEKVIHASETGLDAYAGWDYTISNNGTMQTLLDVTKNIMEEVN